MPQSNIRRLGKASLYTHVMVVPNDGIRRTGKARVAIRLSRRAWDNRKKKDGAPE